MPSSNGEKWVSLPGTRVAASEAPGGGRVDARVAASLWIAMLWIAIVVEVANGGLPMEVANGMEVRGAEDKGLELPRQVTWYLHQSNSDARLRAQRTTQTGGVMRHSFELIAPYGVRIRSSSPGLMVLVRIMDVCLRKINPRVDSISSHTCAYSYE